MRTKGKKIGIVTWYGTPNYGTTLQAYALYRSIADLGFEPYVLKRFSTPFTLRTVKDNFNYNHGIRRFWKYGREPFPKKCKAIKRFCRDNMQERKVTGPLGLRRLLAQTSAFVAGSDQIWNCRDHFREFEFVGFASGVRKFSYASSIGTGDIPEQYRGDVERYLRYFDAISLRERSGAEEIARITGRKDVCTVPDPVFLLRSSQWLKISENSGFKPRDRYILCYFLRKDDSIPDTVKEISSRLGTDRIIVVPSGENPDLRIPGAKVYGKAGIEDFIRLVYNADYVCTDSFHGVAMSIRMHRQFVAFKRFGDTDTSSQNGRIYELLDRFGLQDRVWNGSIPADYDIDEVGKLLDDAREEGLSYLREALELGQDVLPVNSDLHPMEEASCCVAGLPDAGPSSSGGLAFALAWKCLSDGGRVWSTVFDTGLKAVVAEIRSAGDLQNMRGSKYVHSYFGKAAHDALKSAVEDGGEVLFIGTPCQVAGLRKSIGNAPNLLCVDLLCHGTAPAAYLSEEIAYLQKKHHLGAVKGISFRSADKFRLRLEGGSATYEKEAGRQPYMLGYLEGLTLREACYSCPFAITLRTGDITLGDHITSSEGAAAGKSFVSVNTPAGRKAFDSIGADITVYATEGVLEARKSYAPAILRPTEKPAGRDRFIKLCGSRGFAKAVRRVLRPSLAKNHPVYRKMHNLGHRAKKLISFE